MMMKMSPQSDSKLLRGNFHFEKCQDGCGLLQPAASHVVINGPSSSSPGKRPGQREPLSLNVQSVDWVGEVGVGMLKKGNQSVVVDGLTPKPHTHHEEKK